MHAYVLQHRQLPMGKFSLQAASLIDATLTTVTALVSAGIPQAPAAAQAAVTAPGDKPKCRVVTRLSQPGLTAQLGHVGLSQTAGGLQAAVGLTLAHKRALQGCLMKRQKLQLQLM